MVIKTVVENPLILPIFHNNSFKKFLILSGGTVIETGR
jgi:hypothetical protein